MSQGRLGANPNSTSFNRSFVSSDSRDPPRSAEERMRVTANIYGSSSQRAPRPKPTSSPSRPASTSRRPGAIAASKSTARPSRPPPSSAPVIPTDPTTNSSYPVSLPAAYAVSGSRVLGILPPRSSSSSRHSSPVLSAIPLNYRVDDDLQSLVDVKEVSFTRRSPVPALSIPASASASPVLYESVEAPRSSSPSPFDPEMLELSMVGLQQNMRNADNLDAEAFSLLHLTNQASHAKLFFPDDRQRRLVPDCVEPVDDIFPSPQQHQQQPTGLLSQSIPGRQHPVNHFTDYSDLHSARSMDASPVVAAIRSQSRSTQKLADRDWNIAHPSPRESQPSLIHSRNEAAQRLVAEADREILRMDAALIEKKSRIEEKEIRLRLEKNSVEELQQQTNARQKIIEELTAKVLELDKIERSLDLALDKTTAQRVQAEQEFADQSIKIGQLHQRLHQSPPISSHSIADPVVDLPVVQVAVEEIAPVEDMVIDFFEPTPPSSPEQAHSIEEVLLLQEEEEDEEEDEENSSPSIAEELVETTSELAEEVKEEERMDTQGQLVELFGLLRVQFPSGGSDQEAVREYLEETKSERIEWLTVDLVMEAIERIAEKPQLANELWTRRNGPGSVRPIQLVADFSWTEVEKEVGNYNKTNCTRTLLQKLQVDGDEYHRIRSEIIDKITDDIISKLVSDMIN